MSLEALKQALEALEQIDGAMPFPVGKKAITSLRQAIAEAEKQEPVAKGWCNGCNPDNCQGCGPAAKTNDEPIFWYRPVGEDGGYEGPIHNGAIEKVRKLSGIWKPLYTSPKVEQCGCPKQGFCGSGSRCQDAQPEQEPVAWMWLLDGQVWDLCSVKDRFQPIRDGHIQMPLYTHPQPKQPLTDEQVIDEADRFDWDKDCAVRFARAIEAAHGIKGKA